MRIISSFLFLLCFISTFAQIIRSNEAYDNIIYNPDCKSITSTYSLCGNEQEPAKKGIFFNEDKGLINEQSFNVSSIRNYNLNQLEVDIYQPYGEFNSIKWSFGEYCLNGEITPFTIDLSEDATVSFTISTNIDTTDIQMMVEMTDVNDVTLTYGEGADQKDYSESWKYLIGIILPGNNPSNDFLYEGRFDKDNGEIDFEYDFLNAFPTSDEDYHVDLSKSFEYSKVKNVKVTFFNYNRNTEDDYNPYPLKGQFFFKSIRFGLPAYSHYKTVGENIDCEVITSLITKQNKIIKSYPNPATETVNFAKRLTNVEVYNAQGVLVENVPSANALNVASYEAGVYFIKASEGTSRIVVK